MCRPDEYNTMNKAFWSELPHLVEKISDDASARVIVLSSTGKHFCAGMDLAKSIPAQKCFPVEDRTITLALASSDIFSTR